MESVAIISVSVKGAQLGQRVRALAAPGAVCFEKDNRRSGGEARYFSSLKDCMGPVFKNYDYVLCIMSAGIVVRMIAPYVRHKSEDPAVVVMDEAGRHVISLLSGHLGGANEWTVSIASALDADPVITTATDVNGLPAPDVLARHEGLRVEDFRALVAVNSAIVAGERVDYYIDAFLPTAKALSEAARRHAEGQGHVYMTRLDDFRKKQPAFGVLITDKTVSVSEGILVLRPKTYTVGIGCRRGTPKELILRAIEASLEAHGLSPHSALTAASVTVKRDEEGLLEAVRELGWPIVFFSQEEIAPVIEREALTESEFVKHSIGVGNVCETTALLAARSHMLIQEKTIYPKTTVAIAQVPSR